MYCLISLIPYILDILGDWDKIEKQEMCLETYYKFWTRFLYRRITKIHWENIQIPGQNLVCALRFRFFHLVGSFLRSGRIFYNHCYPLCNNLHKDPPQRSCTTLHSNPVTPSTFVLRKIVCRVFLQACCVLVYMLNNCPLNSNLF